MESLLQPPYCVVNRMISYKTQGNTPILHTTACASNTALYVWQRHSSVTVEVTGVSGVQHPTSHDSSPVFLFPVVWLLLGFPGIVAGEIPFFSRCHPRLRRSLGSR